MAGVGFCIPLTSDKSTDRKELEAASLPNGLHSSRRDTQEVERLDPWTKKILQGISLKEFHKLLEITSLHQWVEKNKI